MANTHPRYSVHPSVSYLQTLINNLPQKTGRSIDEWILVLQESGPEDEKERRDRLKKEFNLGGATAWIIAERSVGKSSDGADPDAYLRAAVEYVEKMYAGPKAALRPIHNALIDLGRSLGSDVKISPCKTIVPLYRNHVFAEIKPAARTRIDFGLCLRNSPEKLSDRLVDTGGLAKKDRITHKFEIAALSEIDDEVRHWLKLAYDLDG
ncbi:MAG: DUF5655 domain-containing protein [bacterium]